MFTELPEEYRPQNLPLPLVRQVDLDEMAGLTNDWTASPQGFNLFFYIKTHFLRVFVDAKHVEIVDLFTGKLCLPPEMFLLRVFKAIARSGGPFVVDIQHGFRSGSGWPYRYSPVVATAFSTRSVSLTAIPFGLGSNQEWRELYDRHARRILNAGRYDPNATVSNLEVSPWALHRHQSIPGILSGNEEYILYVPSEVDDVTHE